MAGVLDEVVRVGAAAADPVRQRRQDVGGDDKQRVVLLEERAREDDEEEADGEHERQRDYRLETCCRHRDRGYGVGYFIYLLLLL